MKQVDNIEAMVKPDSPWAWIVLIAACVNYMIELGLERAMYVHLLEWREEFNRDNATTIAIFAVFDATLCFAAMLLAPLIDRYGFRKISFLGSFIFSLGLFLSVFAPNVETLYVTYGLIAGIGSALVFMCPLISIQHHFDKKRPIAIGIASCAKSIGSLVLIPLTRLAIDHYGWRGTMLLSTGLAMQIFICSAFYWPVDLNDTVEKQTEKNEIVKQSSVTFPLVTPDNYSEKHDEIEAEIENIAQTIHNEELHAVMVPNNLFERQLSVISNRFEKSYMNGTEKNETDKQSSIAFPHVVPEYDSEEDAEIAAELESFTQNIYNEELHADMVPNNIYEKQLSVISNRSEKGTINTYDYEETPVDTNQTSKTFLSAIMSWININYNYRLFLNWEFTLFLIGVTLLQYTSAAIPGLIPLKALSIGTTKMEASLLISIVDCVKLFSMLLSGFIANLKCINRVLMYGMAVTLFGLSCVLSTAAWTYKALMADMVLVGIANGCDRALINTVMVDIVGVRQITQAKGWDMGTSTFAFATAMPFAGYLIDVTGNYNIPLIVLGSSGVIGGLIVLVIPVVNKIKGLK